MKKVADVVHLMLFHGHNQKIKVSLGGQDEHEL
jgi:hypothetical protein